MSQRWKELKKNILNRLQVKTMNMGVFNLVNNEFFINEFSKVFTFELTRSI